MTRQIIFPLANLALVAWAVVLAASQAIAGIRDEAPPRVDAFTGIVDRATLQSGDPQLLSRPKSLRAAMVLSDNTTRHLAWCKQQTSGLGSVDRAFQTFFGGAKASADSDRMHMLAYGPKFITDMVTLPLAQRFAGLKLVGSMDEFQRGGFDVLVLIDVSFINTFDDGIVFSKYETGTYVNAYFLDAAKHMLGKIETGGTRPVERNTFLQSVAQLRQETLDQYQTALNNMLGPAVVSAPPPAPQSQQQESVKDRLKVLDELVKQGLLTPEEAAAKRADILKSL